MSSSTYNSSSAASASSRSSSTIGPLILFSSFILCPLLYITFTITLYVLAPVIPIAGYYGRCLASFAAMIVSSSYGLFAAVFLRIVGKPGLAQWTTGRVFAVAMWWVTGNEFYVMDGEEYLKVRPAVFVANHQT